MGTIKGFKVTDSERKTRVGIAAKSLDELKRKTVEKFKLDLPENLINFQMQDGTVIENNEYFQTLEPQTLLIWVRQGERAETDAEILYKIIREVNEEYLTAGEKVQEFFTEKMKSKVFKLAEVLKGIDSNKTELSKREEHPEWFQGIETRAKTKEEYMFRRAQDRVRTYLYKTKEELLKNKSLPTVDVQRVVKELHERLKSVQFFGCYFSRKTEHLIGDVPFKSLCDSRGTFECQGRWDKGACLYVPIHSINPYASREGRIVFQTWNLDHVVERSRSVIPAIAEAIKEEDKVINGNGKGQLDVKAIFKDLFTTYNLKLVHIVCHDKGAHSSKKAGPYLVYL